MSATASFLEFMAQQVGDLWVVARKTAANRQRFGRRCTILSNKEWKELVERYERLTDLDPDGPPGTPCKRVRDASLDLLRALRAATVELKEFYYFADWEAFPAARLETLRHVIDQCNQALEKAEK